MYDHFLISIEKKMEILVHIFVVDEDHPEKNFQDFFLKRLDLY